MVPKKPQRWAGSASCRMKAGGTTRGRSASTTGSCVDRGTDSKVSGDSGIGEQKRVLVTSAGGFIGHHLVKRLKSSNRTGIGSAVLISSIWNTKPRPAMRSRSSICGRQTTVSWPHAAELMRSTVSLPTCALASGRDDRLACFLTAVEGRRHV